MIQQAYVGYVYGDSTCGQRALYQVGMTGIPIINVNNNCSTGSTALFLARQAIESGALDCVLALGFEQMKPGALGAVFTDRPSAFDEFDAAADKLVDAPGVPLALRYFGGAGLSHMKKYGTPLTTFAKVRAKASRHAKNNPLAMFRKEVTADDVHERPGDLARRDDAADGLPADLRRRGCGAGFGEIRQQAWPAQGRPDRGAGHDHGHPFHVQGRRHDAGGRLRHGARRGQQVYEAAGIGPDDLDVVELHDCFAQNELITYEALGLCPDGGAERFIDDGDNTYGGKIVTNPSGGLLSKGHPLGATGLAQCYELTHQLRGSAEAGRSKARGSRCSTISASAAPASSRSTSAPEADMVDQSAIGREFTPVTAHVEPGRLRFFAKAIGETNPVYRDAEAAAAAGYAALPVPPTYLFCLEMMDADGL